MLRDLGLDLYDARDVVDAIAINGIVHREPGAL